MHKVVKSLCSLLLISAAFLCFYFMPPSESKTVSLSSVALEGAHRTESITTEKKGIERLLELFGIGALVLSVWIWRKELGITHLGPLGGSDPVSQQEAGSVPEPSNVPDLQKMLNIEANSSDMQNETTRAQLEQILQMFKGMGSINARHVAHKLRISIHLAKTLLFQLTKEGKIRVDGFPNHAIYTLANSIENKILDKVKEIIAKEHGVLFERRYVRIKQTYKVDSILESETAKFIIEAKALNGTDIIRPLGQWTSRLLMAAKELGDTNIICILALAFKHDTEKIKTIKNQVDRITFDSGSKPIRIIVLSESEL